METSNGSIGHKMNGKPTLNGSINGRAVGQRRRATRRKPGVLAWSFSVAARYVILADVLRSFTPTDFPRLVSWYVIISILFRCPPTLDLCNETSPRVCKPYFQIKHAVAPHLEPYYQTYAAPYVELIKPYYETADRALLTPTRHYVVKYGAPRVAQAQSFGQAQWQKTVQPQLARYQESVRAKYDEQVAPHVQRVSGTVQPYYDIARTNALQTYHELLLPTYRFLEPHTIRSYAAASAFATGTAVPTAIWTWNKTYVFLNGTVWPHLRVVYLETVEPQLVKIGQRLGRHNGNITQKPIAQSTAVMYVSPYTRALRRGSDMRLTSPSSTASSSFTKPSSSLSSSAAAVVTQSPSSIAASFASSVASSVAESDTAEPTETPRPLLAKPVVGNLPEEGENEERRIARETVAEDLQAWQDKYAQAADEGAAEIEKRIAEISKRMTRRQAGTMGKAAVQQLQQTTVAELVQLRRDILMVVGAVQQGSATVADAEDQAAVVVRRAGTAIKQKAQDVRDWHQQYETELRAAVTDAAANHFKILGGIRDLALQKIGMKWAWMDGVTYKDWAKYHQLKDRFNEWEKDLEQLVVSHPSLAEAQEFGQTIEDRGMTIAQTAAKELGRLKQVAIWKIAALDNSNEFGSEAAEALAAKAAQSAEASQPDIVADLLETAGEPEAGTTPGESSAGESGSGILDDASSTVAETPASVLEGQAGEATSSTASRATETSASLTGPDESPVADEPIILGEAPVAEETPIILGDVPVIDEIPIILGNTTEAAEPVDPPVELPVDGIVSEDAVSNAAEDLPEDAVSTAAEDHPEDAVSTAAEDLPEAATEEVDDISEDLEAPQTVTTTIKSVLFGVAAESAPTRKPVIDDDTYDSAAALMASIQTELPQSISSAASSAYSAAISRAGVQYSQALSVVSAQIKGPTLAPHKQMLVSVSSAYSQATESASSKLDDALSAAADFYGSATARILVRSTPTPTPLVDWTRVEAVAAERLSQGQAWAAEQYESARIAVGLASPTPTSPTDRLLEKAKYNYYAGVGVAHARYSEFLSVASSAFSSLTATPTPTDAAGTLSSIASVASESAASAASVVGENVSAAASAASASASSAASAVSENVSSVVAAGYDTAASAASVASAGLEGAASAAAAAGDTVADRWDAVVSKLSVQVYGEPTPTAWYESLASAAGQYAASATDVAGDGASSITSAAGAYAAVASASAASQYASVSSIVSELLVGREPNFSESVYSRLSAAYSTAAASAASVAGVASEGAAAVAGGASEAVKIAGEKVASAASEATEAVKETVSHLRDEL